MPHFSPQQLQVWAGGHWHAGVLPARDICGFTQDTRQLRDGMCFVALKTGRRDGHDFLDDAQAAGAVMALVAAPVTDCTLAQLVVADPLAAFQQIAARHRRQFTAPVIGVSGSCGKTSTKNMLSTLLGGRCHATAGNLNNFIGVPLTLLGLEAESEASARAAAAVAAATPAAATDAAAERARLGDGVEASGTITNPATATAKVHTVAVVEAGISEPGEMDLLADMIAPDICVLTMIGPAHLECLQSVEAVAAEKIRLAKPYAMPVANAGNGQGADGGTERTPLLLAPLSCWRFAAFAQWRGQAVAVAPAACAGEKKCADDGIGKGVGKNKGEGAGSGSGESTCAAGGANGNTVTDTASPDVHYYHLENNGRTLRLEGARLSGSFTLGFTPSDGMASNLALALLAAHACGVTREELAQRIRNWEPSGNRGQWQRFAGRGQTRFFVDCYNANPASMQDSLDFFVRSTGGSTDSSAGESRLFVLGGMRELGAASADWHRRVGEYLGQLLARESECESACKSAGSETLHRTDTVILIGEASDNAALEQGLHRYAAGVAVHSFMQTQQAREWVDAFTGAVFLKGSRFYALETLLPQSP